MNGWRSYAAKNGCHGYFGCCFSVIQNTQADFFFGILQNRNKYAHIYFKITKSILVSLEGQDKRGQYTTDMHCMKRACLNTGCVHRLESQLRRQVPSRLKNPQFCGFWITFMCRNRVRVAPLSGPGWPRSRAGFSGPGRPR